jgi:putative ABC transport system permease protein
MRDIRTAWRALSRSGPLPLVIVGMLGLAIATATAIFSIANAVLLRPLPFRDADRLVMLWGRNDAQAQAVMELSLLDYRAWSQTRTLANLELVSSVNWSHRITAPGEPFSAAYSAVTGSFFDTLGAPAMLGRTFSRDDDKAGARATAVLSADLWRRRFGSNQAIVGTSITIGEGDDATPHEVIGVMGPDFRFPRGTELWTPARRELAEFARQNKEATDGVRVFYGVGRLADGVALDSARADLSAILREFEIRNGDRSSRAAVTVTPLLTFFFGPARPAVLAIAAGIIVLVLIACANAAGLLIANGLARRREIAVRLAIGATRAHLLRQSLAEAALLVVSSGVLGVVLASVTFKALVALAPADVPRLDDASINGASLAFAVIVCVITCAVVAVAPAWHFSRAVPADALQHRTYSTTTAPRGGRARKLLVVAQLGAAVVLLAAAGLLAKSFVSLMRADLGFDPRNVVTFHVAAPAPSYDTPAKQRALVERIIGDVEQLPGVVAAGAIYERPFANGPIGMDSGVLLEGQPLTGESVGKNPIVNWESVTTGYFRAMDIRLVRGRYFDQRDVETAPPTIIVSERLAARLWPGQDPIGKRLISAPFGDKEPLPWQSVVGVVEDARYREIEAPRFDLYLPHRQAFAGVKHFVIRAPQNPAVVAGAIRQRVTQIDAAVTVEGIQMMEDIVGRTVAPWRFSMFVFSTFSVMALAFAAIGLAAVMAYNVKQRTREMGVRIALGARPGQVVRMLVSEGIWLAGAGLAIGLPAAWGLTRFLSSLLFDVTPTDAVTFALVVLVLAAVALIAAYLPARHAAAIDPVGALRAE